MRPRCSPILLAAAMASAVVMPMCHAEDGDAKVSENKTKSGPSQEYIDQIKEMDALVSAREMDLYEMAFEPINLADIVLRDRLGHDHAYTYLTFRLRNTTSLGDRVGGNKMPRYTEVLKAIADQYAELAKVSTEGGGKVTVGDEKKDPDAVVLERRELAVKERAVNISVLASDEHGSRIQLLDEPIGSGKQNEFPFADHGNIRIDASFEQVRDKIEELADRRLRTPREIRSMKLAAYDPAQRDAEGVAAGEVFGVAIFPRFDVLGTEFTIEVRGLCNKQRIVVPPVEEGKPENYLAMRLMRRTMVLKYLRPGDEFNREVDQFTLLNASYQWVDTFQRLDKRKTMALTKHYLDNVRGADSKRKPEVEQAFWKWYAQFRSDRPQAADKLPDLEATLKTTDAVEK